MNDRYKIAIEAGTPVQDVSAGRSESDHINEQGLSNVKQGQLVTGTVVSAGEQITLDFDGQEVTTQNSALKDVQPGDQRTFEVVKATAQTIELRLQEDNTSSDKTIVAVRVMKTDWDTLIDQKEQIAQKSEQEELLQKVKDQLSQITATLTEEDCSALEEEGFPMESFTLEGLKEALSRMKSEEPSDADKADKAEKADRAHQATAPKTETAKTITDPEKKELTDWLQKAQLPVTQDNLSRLSQALKLSDTVGKIDDKTMKLLIAADKVPSVANIYKAYYSKTNQDNKDTVKLSETAWKELENQVKEVITKAGYEVTEQNLADAKWLIENKLPLNTETFTYKKDLEAVKANSGRDELIDKMLTGMKKGISPEEVSLVSENPSHNEKLITQINQISDEAISQAVQSDCKLTIKNLIAIQESIKTQISNQPDPSGAQTVDKTKQEQPTDTEKNVKADVHSPEQSRYRDKATAYITKTADKIDASAEKIINDAAKLLKTAAGDTDEASDDIKEASGQITKLAKDILLKASEIADMAKAGKEPPDTTGSDDTATKQVSKSPDNGVAYSAADIIKAATKITQCSVEISHGAMDVAQATTDSDKRVTDTTDKAIDITKAAVDITREISDITKAAMKLIDITQDIDKPVTNLVQTAVDHQVQEEMKSHDNESEQGSKDQPSDEPKDSEYEELKAQRQLQEIRLKMTLEAAGRLEKKGISVDTQELSRVVDELRGQEDEYYKKLLTEADAEVTDTSVQTLKDTTQALDKLKQLPCSVLGSTLTLRDSQTMEGLVEEGSKLQAEYVKAGTAYETLATVPNAEYGDSLKKAFSNADSLLKQLGLEDTQANRRAIRILGYNQMEVTKESVDQVKAYDRQVTDLIQNLHPAVTARMVKDGVNPLNLPITELNRMVDRMKEEQGVTSEDKYSTYLRNLEKQEGISDDERKAYIGIYRLLYNVEKSDGAVVGAVVKANREVTLGNLLTAIQTNKKGSLNAAIDDEFGTLQSITRKGETITQQLGTLSGSADKSVNPKAPGTTLVENQTSQKASAEGQPLTSTDLGTMEDNKAAADKEKTEYLDRILRHIKEELTPEKLSQAGNIQSLDAASQRQLISGSDRSIAAHGIWEQIKEVPVEKLFEKLQNSEDVQTVNQQEYKAKVQELREISKNAEQSLRFLNDYKLPATPLNIMMANNLLVNKDTPIKKLLKLKNENRVENSEKGLKETNDLSDTLVDKNSMQQAYEALETDAKQLLQDACGQERIDSRRLAELKGMSQQVTFMRKLAQREFYQIPVETDKGITNMNLTILRGSGTSGTVSVNAWSEQLGNVKAEFVLKGQTLKGYISSDDRSGLKQLQSNAGILADTAKDCNVNLRQLDFAFQQGELNHYSYQSTQKEESYTKADTERILYRIAKAVVQTVRMTENSGNEQDRAVS